MAAPEEKSLKEKLSALPDAPGVYIFKDHHGNILYIGKAKSLKKRARSYFTRFLSAKTQALVSKIKDIEHIRSSSESQAQILEAALVKEKQPPYNIDLKDDKSFPLIKISREEFPLVSICRAKMQKEKDAALYYGPYTNVKLLRQALKSLRRVFAFRSCRILPRQACLYWRLNLCPGPCLGKITPERYAETIKEIRMFLESRNEELLDRLYAKMKQAAADKDFEAAAVARDQINSLSSILEAADKSGRINELEALQDLLKLKALPRRIEAFDISNISGVQATGSMVSFLKGGPDKNNYRRFRIKTVNCIDDYAMLREVVERRYSRLIEEKAALPDLILIDGGKAHLAAALGVIKDLRLDIPLAAIAKDRENIYLPGRNEPIRLKEGAAALNLIRRVRDEAHRFAIKYHHLLRKKKIIGK